MYNIFGNMHFRLDRNSLSDFTVKTHFSKKKVRKNMYTYIVLY